MTTRILLLSGYDALSHRHWHETLTTMLPEFQWTRLTLPARHFSWRLRGSALSWGLGDYPELDRQHDLLVATSMVDLASLRGLRPALADLPAVVYFHENQFAYPAGDGSDQHAESTRLNANLVGLYAALCANAVAFNSAFNRRTFLAGMAELLERLPDRVPTGLVGRLESALVLPVPLGRDLATFTPRGTRDGLPLSVAWNHRWEHDKGPELLQGVAAAVIARDLPVRFVIMGQRFRTSPAVFEVITALLEDHARTSGIQHRIGTIPDRSEYLAELAQCDVVLSTARHDFQGLAILEGCALGCTPLCPDELVYPEYLGEEFLYDTDAAVTAIVSRLESWLQLKSAGGALPCFDPLKYRQDSLKESYLALFERLLSTRGASRATPPAPAGGTPLPGLSGDE